MRIREIIKKIPFTLPFYVWIMDVVPFLFYTEPEVLNIQGSKMYLNVREQDKDMRKTFRAYAKNRVHEPRTTQFVQDILNQGDIFVDLGANIGYFSLLAARTVGKGGRVFSFEPENRNFKYLTRNKELNNYDQITAVQKAISNKKDKIKLYICPYDTGHHTINQSEGITSYATAAVYEPDKITYAEIETVTLDEFLSSQGVDKVDLIKMDVEGAELLALQGMEKTVKSNDNLKMIIEFFPLLLEKMGSLPKDFLNKLTDGYQFMLYEISDDYNAEHTTGGIFLRKINNYEDLLHNYSQDAMYHSNLFAIKSMNKNLQQILSNRSS